MHKTLFNYYTLLKLPQLSLCHILDRVIYMKKFNEKKIAVTHRKKEDFYRDFSLNDLFTITEYSPSLGIIIDWSCHDDPLFKVT